MKILFLTDGVPINGSLIGIFEADQAAALQKAGNEVLLVAFDSFSLREKRKLGVYQSNEFCFQIKIISIPIGRRPLKFCADIASLIFRKVLKTTIIDRFQPDIVHAHFYFQGYIAIKCKDVFRCPIVITEHSSLINKINIRNDIYRVAKIGYINADGVIAVSSALKEKMTTNFGIDPTVIPNIVDIGVFNAEKQEKKHKCSFISVGNLVPLKNMNSLINAFIHSFTLEDDVILTVFGDGPERKRLQKKIEDAGYEKIIILAGRVPRATISEEFSKSNCFVLASKSETFCVSCIEAMATGLPVIATRCGGPEDYMNEDCGILVNVNDQNGLMEALLYMADNYPKYRKEAIINYVNSNFSPEVIAKKITGFYRQIIGGWNQ